METALGLKLGERHQLGARSVRLPSQSQLQQYQPQVRPYVPYWNLCPMGGDIVRINAPDWSGEWYVKDGGSSDRTGYGRWYCQLYAVAARTSRYFRLGSYRLVLIVLPGASDVPSPLSDDLVMFEQVQVVGQAIATDIYRISS